MCRCTKIKKLVIIEVTKHQCYSLLSRSDGGSGAVDLANAVVGATQAPSDFKFLYPLDMSIEEKIATIAKKIYGADGVELLEEARAKAELYTKQVYSILFVLYFLFFFTIKNDWI